MHGAAWCSCACTWRHGGTAVLLFERPFAAAAVAAAAAAVAVTNRISWYCTSTLPCVYVRRWMTSKGRGSTVHGVSMWVSMSASMSADVQGKVF